MTGEQTKYLDWETLRNDGYLQEVNRQFFHPLGLALAVVIPTKPGEPDVALQILDYRHDREGMNFAAGDLTVAAGKLHDIARLRRVPRVNALGYWVQPTGGAEHKP
jgi:hypothetical protein